MNNNDLDNQIKLFAYITGFCSANETLYAKSFINVYLSQQFSVNTVNLKSDLFEAEVDYNLNIHTKIPLNANDIQSQIINYCTQLNSNLSLTQKYHFILYLLEFVKILENNQIAKIVTAALNQLDTLFNIPPDEFLLLKHFVSDEHHKIPDKNNILVISGLRFSGKSGIKYVHIQNLKGQIFVINAKSINSFLFKIKGTDNLTLNNQHLYQNNVYFFKKGLAIRGNAINPIYYSHIEQYFSLQNPENNIAFKVNNISYRFNKNTIAIHPFSISAYSGQLNAILGDSGVGKTTLLNILNGNLVPDLGNITLNNIDIKKKKSEITGLIGYVPQDDILFEDLTVFQNLFYNAQLCFANLPKTKIIEKVNNTLHLLELSNVKHLKVGNILNKFISGGQRKRLNIAMELIREPAILFVDEPTSGLSSSDSLKVIKLLKIQTLNGKLIFVNIHQPSSDIFKNFDNLLILDKGGYPVYWGNPVESISYFKEKLNLVDSQQNECLTCGSVNPEEILHLIDYKHINVDGLPNLSRIYTPQQWYNFFISENSEAAPMVQNPKITNAFKPPEKWAQFVIFFIRNLQAKLANKQYLLISLFETPFLAIILGFFFKTNQYSNT